MRKLTQLLPRPLQSGARSLVKALSAINDPTTSWTTRLDAAQPATQVRSPNPLEVFFDAHTTGRGIWKWRHYFDIYHRHLSRFVDREVHILEIGVYSGGSLEMWKQYFGPRAKIYGVDIEPACKSYEDDQVKIFIGDQRRTPSSGERSNGRCPLWTSSSTTAGMSRISR